MAPWSRHQSLLQGKSHNRKAAGSLHTMRVNAAWTCLDQELGTPLFYIFLGFCCEKGVKAVCQNGVSIDSCMVVRQTNNLVTTHRSLFGFWRADTVTKLTVLMVDGTSVYETYKVGSSSNFSCIISICRGWGALNWFLNRIIFNFITKLLLFPLEQFQFQWII